MPGLAGAIYTGVALVTRDRTVVVNRADIDAGRVAVCEEIRDLPDNLRLRDLIYRRSYAIQIQFDAIKREGSCGPRTADTGVVLSVNVTPGGAFTSISVPGDTVAPLPADR